jgi:hypothetical protein
MLPLLILFVIWLLLNGRLATYIQLVQNGPGFALPTASSVVAGASSALGGVGGNPGYSNPMLYPSTVAKQQQQVQNTAGNPPLSQSSPSGGQSASVWPFN